MAVITVQNRELATKYLLQYFYKLKNRLVLSYFKTSFIVAILRTGTSVKVLHFPYSFMCKNDWGIRRLSENAPNEKQRQIINCFEYTCHTIGISSLRSGCSSKDSMLALQKRTDVRSIELVDSRSRSKKVLSLWFRNLKAYERKEIKRVCRGALSMR